MPRKPLGDTEQRYLRTLGAAIRELRKSQGLSQEQLGARAGIPGTRIGEVELGKVDTSVSRIRAIAQALGVKPSDILRRQETAEEGETSARQKRQRLHVALGHLDARQLDVLLELVAQLRRSAG